MKNVGVILLLAMSLAAGETSQAAPVPVEEGVVADPKGGIVYALGKTGQLTALNASNGALLWKSDHADVPLSADADGLLALDRGEALVTLDPRFGKVRHRCAPKGVPLAMNRTYNSAATMAGMRHGGHTYVSWGASTWYAGGPRPSKEIEQAARSSSSGAARVIMASCKVTMLSGDEADAIAKKGATQPPEGPHHVGPWTIDGVTLKLLHRKVGKEDVVTLERTPTGGATTTVEVGRADFHLPTYASADGRHFITIASLPTGKDGRSNMRVTLWSAAKGKPIAKFATHEHVHRFVMIGKRMIAKGMPEQFHEGGKSILRGYRVRAIDTSTGREVWAHYLESLMPKAGPPGTPPSVP